MSNYLHIVMELGGDEYTPELNDDQMHDIVITARDIADGEWPGSFVRAASINYDTMHLSDITNAVLALIEVNKRSAA